LHQLDTFYNALNPNDQDALDSATGGNFLDKIPRKCLSIIESKSNVRYSRGRVTDMRANANATPLSSSSHSNSFDLQQISAALKDKLDIRYEDAIVVPPINANNFELKQTLINLVQSNQFTGRQDPHNHLRFFNKDALDSIAGGNFLDKIPRECLSIIESKSKVRYSRSRVTDVKSNANANLSSSQSNSFDLQQIAAALEDKLDIRMNRFEKSLNEMKNSIVPPTAPLKAVTEVCITCGLNHSYNQCPLTRGENDYPVFHDNIQQFQTAAVGNFIQNRQNQTRPPGFHQPTQQNNNQNRFQSNNLN
nr:hypothetical protein [Tanacetum cinerariifolium]